MTFVGGSRGLAITELLRGVGYGDILTLLTGAPGVGKSTVLNAALQALAEQPIKVIRLTNPGGSTWTLRALGDQLLGRPVETLTDLAVAAAVTELTGTTGGEASIVIAVDDAQSLTDEAMEFLLLLASPARRRPAVTQLVLVGCGEFWKRGWRSELQLITSLAECVTLDPFAGADGGDYIAWCLRRVEGAIDYTVTPDAAAIVLRHSGGFAEKIAPILAASISIAACRRDPSLTSDVVEAAIDSLATAPDVPDATLAAIMTAPSVSASDGSGPRRRTGVAPVARPPVADPGHQPDAQPAWTRLRDMSDVMPAAGTQMVVPLNGTSSRISKSGIIPLIVAPGFKRSVRAAATSVSIVVLAATGFALLRDDAADRAAAAIDWVRLQGPTHLARVLWNSPTQASAASNIHPGEAMPGPAGDAPVRNGSSSDEQPRAEEKPTTEPVVTAQGGSDSPSSAAVVSVMGAEASGAPVEAANTVPAPPAPEAVHDLAAVIPPEPSNGGQVEPAVAESREAIEVKVEQQADTTAAIAPTQIASAAADRRPAVVGPVPAEIGQEPVIASAATARAIPDQPAIVTLAPATRSPTHPVATSSLPPVVVASLLRRADTLLRQGDVLTARLFYERAAAAGSGEGATGAGKTYDPRFLSTIDAPGLRGDAARATEWYRTAAIALGDREAGERLKALTGR